MRKTQFQGKRSEREREGKREREREGKGKGRKGKERKGQGKRRERESKLDCRLPDSLIPYALSPSVCAQTAAVHAQGFC